MKITRIPIVIGPLGTLFIGLENREIRSADHPDYNIFASG